MNETRSTDGLAEAFDELTSRLQAGETIEPAEIDRLYPEYADELRKLLPALAALGEFPGVDEGQEGDRNGSTPRELGDFRIVREVGRGGMGVVYEAEQLSLGRRVALKVLPFAATMDSRQLQRFKNEAQAAASLEHEHIVPVFGVGNERGVHYYAMKFVEGATLAAVVRDLHRPATASIVTDATGEYIPGPGRATTPQVIAGLSTENSSGPAFFRMAARLMIQAADALEHAHSMGVVHRDVKPGNLMIDASGNLWVTDFGLARTAANASLTVSGDLVGTLRYMSPEQAMARHGLVDHRTDIYALGATLYELLTGRPVVTGDDKHAILRQIAFEEPIPPRTCRKEIPADLETIVLKALEKTPADRYATAKEVADDLRRFLDGEPVRAKRPSLTQRASKWARRHQPVLATAMVALLVISIGLGAAVGKVMAAKHEADERDAETRAVLHFVEEKIFAAARPEGVGGGLGHEVTLRRAIEAALPFVETSFTDRPLIEARLRLTLGLSFRHLGEDAVALQQFRAAHALYQKHRGPNHPDTLTAQSKLANTYDALGRQADSLRLREETLKQREAMLGPDHPSTLDSKHNLAVSYDEAGRHEEALKLRIDVLARREATAGPDHPDTLASMNNLAISYHALGRHDEALKLRETTLERQKAKVAPDTEGLLAAMHNLAKSYHAVGRDRDARDLYDETLTVANDKLPPNHPKLLLVMNNLAWLLATAPDASVRDPRRAVELAEKVVALSPHNAGYTGTLGTARFRTGDWQRAALELEKAISLRNPHDGANANESFFLAMTRWQLGDKTAARAWFDKGTAWMNQSKSQKEVRRFRGEAAALLGIQE